MTARKAPNAHSPKLRVGVTDNIIKVAVPQDSGHCMIADAIREAFPSAQFIAVDVQTIRFSDPKKRLRYTYLTPRRAQRALLQFDQAIKPQPFEFTISDAQVSIMGAGHRPAGQKKLVKHPDGHKIPRVVGGRTPPRGALATGADIPKARRRAFGLRSAGLI